MLFYVVPLLFGLVGRFVRSVGRLCFFVGWLFVCVVVCLHVCLFGCLIVRLSVYDDLFVCWIGWLLRCFLVCLESWVFVCFVCVLVRQVG